MPLPQSSDHFTLSLRPPETLNCFQDAVQAAGLALNSLLLDLVLAMSLALPPSTTV